MRAITLTQPYATLIAIGAKKIETRSWSTSYRGQIAIHAAAGLGPVGGKTGLMSLVANEPFLSTLSAWRPASVVRPDYWLPRGAIVAVAELVECLPTGYLMETAVHCINTGDRSYSWLAHPWSAEHAFGDYTPGRYAWLLADVRALSEPIPAKGALGLWDWTPPEGFSL